MAPQTGLIVMMDRILGIGMRVMTILAGNGGLCWRLPKTVTEHQTCTCMPRDLGIHIEDIPRAQIGWFSMALGTEKYLLVCRQTARIINF
jgi:hypothetical protein